MAMSQLVDTNFRLVYETGVDGNGDPIFKRKSYSNVKPSTSDDQIFQAAHAIGSLCSHTLYTIERDDTKEIYA